MSMLSIGKTYNLPVLKITQQGVYLDAEDLGEVLLPHKFCPGDVEIDDHLPVFLYHDSSQRLIATTQAPKAEIGEFAYLKAVSNSDFGTFLDWGLDKDLLVPFGEQHRPMETGHSYLVFIYLNNADGRIVASSKIEKFLDDRADHDFTVGQQVELIIANSTELGFKAIVNNGYWGLLYKDEVHEKLSFGEYRRGHVKFIRPDNKIDLVLKQEQHTRDKFAQTVLNYLNKHGGSAPVHDKSDPALIQELFGMSKKSFKKTIGGLYKQRIIVIEADGIRLSKL